jgi:hypothetical protein
MCIWCAPPGRKGGAYIAERLDACGVPRADVRVEPPRLVERLRANKLRSTPSEGARMFRHGYVHTQTPNSMRASTHSHARGDACGVPRADVRVEHRRLLERLRAEQHAVHAAGECEHIRSRTCALKHPQACARTHMDEHVGVSMQQARIVGTLVCLAISMDIDMCTCHVHGYDIRVRSIDGLRKRERRTRTNAVYSRIGSTRMRTHVYASVTQRDNSLTYYTTGLVCIHISNCAQPYLQADIQRHK